MGDKAQNSIVYGPVPSRRLGKWRGEILLGCGNSLGLNIAKCKVCSCNCSYCSCGKTFKLTKKPGKHDYFSLKEIEQGLEAALKRHLKENTKIDYISLVGWTEPTLHPCFADVANLFFEMKQKYFPKKPTAIFTNSTTLDNENVRKALKRFDRTFFKLDCTTNGIFHRINQPVGRTKIEDIIDNLADFSNKTTKIELSAMVLKTNYKDIASFQYVKALKKIKSKNNRIYLCTPDWLKPTGKKEGISMMPSKGVTLYVKKYLESFNYRATILPPKREGLHPLVKFE